MEMNKYINIAGIHHGDIHTVIWVSIGWVVEIF